MDIFIKAVDLCFRQRVSADVFDRVLGGQYLEGFWHLV